MCKNDRFHKLSNKKYLCFRWIKSWERKGVFESANHLGQVLVERKIHLVYGGGSLGLIGCVSIPAFLGGSQVLGVVPKALEKRDIIGKTIGEELQVSTMSDRMNTMFNHADAFIALPGGLGTLEEIFHISSWAQLHIHHKPIGLLNVNGFYDNLLSFLDQAVEQQYLTSSARQIIISVATAEQQSLLLLLNN